MNSSHTKLWALILVLALMPGAFELVENVAHLLGAGHLAHAAVEGAHHEPTGPEHGCTPVFHVCGCHASVAFLVASQRLPVWLGPAGFSAPPEQALPLTDFHPSVDHPPRA